MSPLTSSLLPSFSGSLICSATYTVHSSGEELLLRKFFKFSVCHQLQCSVYVQTVVLCCLHVVCVLLHNIVYICAVLQVAKPLDVKTKFMNVEVCVNIDCSI